MTHWPKRYSVWGVTHDLDNSRGNCCHGFFCMATITALQAQKRHADRINVYLDGKFAFGLASAAATAAGLQVGQTLSEADVAELQQQDLVDKARQNALRLLGYRPRSIMEVEQKLRQKGYADAVIMQTIDRLVAVDLLNDAAFAAYWVEQRETFKPRSHFALRQELQTKGISRALIDEALAGVDEVEAARRAARLRAQRWRNLPQEAFSAKLGQFLQRRGFSYDIIQQITRETWRANHQSE